MELDEIRNKLASREWTVEQVLDELKDQGIQMILFNINEVGWMASMYLQSCIGEEDGSIEVECLDAQRPEGEEPQSIRDAILSAFLKEIDQ